MKIINQLLFVFLASLSLSVQAGLIGDQVDMSVPLQSDLIGVTVDASQEGYFSFGSDESIVIDVFDSSINIMVFDYTGYWEWETDPVTVTISDLDFGSSFDIITSESVNAIGPVVWDYGVDFISATFTGSIYLDTIYSGVVLDIEAELVPQSVPEPAPISLMILGLAGIMLAKYKSRHN